MLIADISVVLSWFYDEDQTSMALEILKRIETEGLLVPPLWWCELENGIVMGERRGGKSPDESMTFLNLVRALPIRTDDAPRHSISEDILTIAHRHQLTAYDAAYVELALRETAKLATFDSAIRCCALQLGILLLPDKI